MRATGPRGTLRIGVLVLTRFNLQISGGNLIATSLKQSFPRAYAFHIPLAINARQGPGAFHSTTTLLTLESDPSPFAVDASALIRGLLI